MEKIAVLLIPVLLGVILIKALIAPIRLAVKQCFRINETK